jgi:hypothetical protein
VQTTGWRLARARGPTLMAASALEAPGHEGVVGPGSGCVGQLSDSQRRPRAAPRLSEAMAQGGGRATVVV